MPAPKGNTNAAKPGESAVFRIRFRNPGDIDRAKLLTPEQLGWAVEAYLLWLELPESDESPYLEWLKAQAG